MEEVNQDLRDIRNQLKESIPLYVKDKTENEIESFIDLRVLKNIDVIKKEFTDKMGELVTEQQKLDNVNNILSKKNPVQLRKIDLQEIITCIKFINSLLLKSFDSLKEDAVSKLQNHINSNFTNLENAESWIKQGLEIRKHCEDDANCPFCGQDLKNVVDLIDAYQEYFNEEYTRFIIQIETSLDNSLQKFRSKKIEYSKNLSDSLLIIKDYNSLITDDSFHENISFFERQKDAVIQSEQKLIVALENIILELTILIEAKKRTPHKKGNIADYSVVKQLIEEFEQKGKEIETLNAVFIKIIKEFKDSYISDEKSLLIVNLTQEIKDLERKKYRLEQNCQCEKYSELKDTIKQLEGEQEVLKSSLVQSQSVYLARYFRGIDQLFNQFGSKDFTLEMETDDRGIKKVYGLSVKFKNQKITYEQLPVIFSESDRRALALAIFWTKINIKSDEERKNTIIIFDDPITSFDDQRVTKTINLLKETLSKVSQIIVLTHYQNFISRFLEITKSQQIAFKLLEIKKESTTCKINELEAHQFILDEHNKKFLNLYDFINRKHDDDIKSEIRPYFENQLNRIFIKQISDNNIDNSSLENLINGLIENNIIKEAQKNRLHEFRITSNPDNHIFTSNNKDDVRNFASEMFDFLHSPSLPNLTLV